MTGEWSFVWAAYIVTWVALLLYAGYIRGRIRAAERDLVEPIDPGEVYRGVETGRDDGFGAGGAGEGNR